MICDHCEQHETSVAIFAIHPAGMPRLEFLPAEARCMMCYRELWEEVSAAGGSVESQPVPAAKEPPPAPEGREAAWKDELLRLAKAGAAA